MTTEGVRPVAIAKCDSYAPAIVGPAFATVVAFFVFVDAMKRAGIKVEYLSAREIIERGLDPAGLNPARPRPPTASTAASAMIASWSAPGPMALAMWWRVARTPATRTFWT